MPTTCKYPLFRQFKFLSTNTVSVLLHFETKAQPRLQNGNKIKPIVPRRKEYVYSKSYRFFWCQTRRARGERGGIVDIGNRLKFSIFFLGNSYFYGNDKHKH